MKTLPENLDFYTRTLDFTEDTVPSGILGRHSTAAGTWGKIKVTEGNLTYRILDHGLEEYVLDTNHDGIVLPQAAHQVEVNGPVKFHIEFYRRNQAA